MIKRSSWLLFIGAAFLLYISCGDDGGGGPGAPAAVKKCELSADTLNWGEVCVGDSADMGFTISAPSDNTEKISGTVSASCSHFRIVSGGGAYELAAGESWSVTVRYKPTAAGSHMCVVQTGACKTVTCLGSGNDKCEVCEVSPTSLNFGGVCVSASSEKTFTISAPATNRKPVTGSVSESCDHYSITSGGGAYTLNPGQSRTVRVRFAPTTTGIKTCDIETGPNCPNVSSTGVGDAAVCTVAPGSLDFGSVCVGTSAEKTFTITCPSTSPCPISGTVSENCSHFSITSGGGAYTLNPGQSRTVRVRYAPTSTGSHNCTIETGAACANLPASGTGVQATCTVSTTSLNFGTICPIGGSTNRTFTITCPSASPCALSGTVSESSSEYSIVSGGGSYTLNPGQSRTVTVQFKPTSTGTKTTTIQTGALCANVTCTGVGQEYKYYELRPTSNNTFQWRSNFLTSSPSVSASGVTFEDPSWNGCETGWRVDGSGIEENGWTLNNFPVPSGSNALIVEYRADAQNSCVEVLIQIDGTEHVFTNPRTFCTAYSRTVAITAGSRDIMVGTDQTGLFGCGDDIVFICRDSGCPTSGRWIRYTFRGACTTSIESYSGEGAVTLVKPEVDPEERE